MESQLQHTHGRHYDDQDPLTATATATAGHRSGHDYNEEHHGEKKSVIKKVKEKAKKLKNTITKHGHGHGDSDQHQDHQDEEDDDDDEMEKDAEVHGAPMYDSARVGLGGPDAIFAQPRGNLERPSMMAEDRYTGHSQEVNPEKWRGKIGAPTGMEEHPFAPNPTPYGSRHVADQFGNRGSGQDMNQEGLRGRIGKSTGMVEDPNGPKGSAPSNYETKVTDPTHTGGKEAQLSQIQHSLGKMGIRDEHDSSSDFEPKTLEHNHPENLPRDTVTGNPSSRSSSYVEKISSSASAIADKAADVITSKLGYSSQTPSTGQHETGKSSGAATDYAHKITDTVTGTLAPVYEKVVDAGSAVMSKVQGSVSGTGQPQVQRGSDTRSGSRTMEKGREADKGVSVKEYLVETLKPGDEDKALSDVITHAFHRGNHGESEKKSGEDRPIDRVTESVEVRERLGSDHREEHEHSGNVITADKGVADRLIGAMGSWFGGKGNVPQGSLGTSFVTDEGLSSNPPGSKKSGSGRQD
ncbi:low-temperature-induced 65 kDa protein [Lactuca sativa]|uniref:low-temperature-induced 65 kDa protein n=1 Tax=Lactuca sativa TaxID=4236 RepID=UPI000CC173FB|nr:low-temperature-induced 65 kDa protein [Lactuca sativa]